MKKVIGFFVLVLFSVIYYSCSCIPADSRVLGKYKLINVVKPNGTISYKDSALFMEFTLFEEQGINEIREAFFRDSIEIARYNRASVENFCKKGQKDEFNVHYENGKRRHYNIPAPNELEASDYLSEGEPDTLLFHYEAVY